MARPPSGKERICCYFGERLKLIGETDDDVETENMHVLITFKRRSGRHDSSGTHGHSMMMMMSITISATDQSSKGDEK